MKKRVLLLGLVVLMVLTSCGTTEKETKTKEKDPDKLVLNIEDKKEDDIQEIFDGMKLEELPGGHTAKGVEYQEGQIFIREENHVGGMVKDKDSRQRIDA